jgi:hypothetical protein
MPHAVRHGLSNIGGTVTTSNLFRAIANHTPPNLQRALVHGMAFGIVGKSMPT